jgi:hypothetical protein
MKPDQLAIGHYGKLSVIRIRKEVNVILEEIRRYPDKKIHNAGPASNYGDDKKLALVQREPGITLFLNTHVIRTEKNGNMITSVTGKNIISGKESRFRGKSYLPIAQAMARSVFFQERISGRAGKDVMKQVSLLRLRKKITSLWVLRCNGMLKEQKRLQNFPHAPGRFSLMNHTCHKETRGDWDWETGLNRDQVREVSTYVTMHCS